ncbi:hypothetical protein C2845_PM07G12270 [Panicum miliaceum]|uniref:Uncharacterized protein n=1 Tax=Panicum miliaceum TaxID=4540 RepID=A0A3L6SR22_PANMI|nr:hypothetical protein C2845_PM07G12270 [Panicum miliaceum]
MPGQQSMTTTRPKMRAGIGVVEGGDAGSAEGSEAGVTEAADAACGGAIGVEEWGCAPMSRPCPKDEAWVRLMVCPTKSEATVNGVMVA